GPNWVGLTNTLETTRSTYWRTSRTSEKWPACRLPMVGTKPTRRPSRFQPRTRSRSASSSVMVSIIGTARKRGKGSGVGVRGVGEAAVAHGLGVGAHGAGHRAAFGQEILDEARAAVAAVQPEEV